MASLLGGAYTDSESSEEEGNKGAEQGKPESELDAEPEPKRPRKHEPEPTPGDFIDPSFDDLLPPVTNASPNPEVQERIANFIAKSEQQQRDFTQVSQYARAPPSQTRMIAKAIISCSPSKT
jgi:hypothetical protein